MDSLFAIGWVLWLALAIVGVQDATHALVLTRLFPEGRRWWMLPLFLMSLVFFAACVRFAPW